MTFKVRSRSPIFSCQRLQVHSDIYLSFKKTRIKIWLILVPIQLPYKCRVRSENEEIYHPSVYISRTQLAGEMCVFYN